MNKQKINTFINFAVRARKVIFGVDKIKTSKIIPLVIIYDEALSDNSKKQIDKYSLENNVQLFKVEKDYLNNLLKRNNVKVIGIVDESLAKAIIDNWLLTEV